MLLLAGTPARSQDSTQAPAAATSGVIEVAAEIRPRTEVAGLASGAIAFEGPGGSGRRYTRGVLLKNDPLTGGNGSTWSFSYTRRGGPPEIQIIHPYGGGQIISHLRKTEVGISTPRAWIEIGYGGDAALRARKGKGFDEIFPLNDDEVYQVVSKLDGKGNYELAINGKVVATGTVKKASPLSLEIKDGAKRPPTVQQFGAPAFKGDGLPMQWAAGYAAVLLAPTEAPAEQNVCRDVRFAGSASVDGSNLSRPEIASAAPPAQVASAPRGKAGVAKPSAPTVRPATPAPAPIAPAATPATAPVAALAPASAPAAASRTQIAVLIEQGVNANHWVTADLDQAVPSEIRDHIVVLREDLQDELKSKPAANQDAYAKGVRLCNALIEVLDERDQKAAHAGFRAVEANARLGVSSQTLEARRNYQMSWPQFARETTQRNELKEQAVNNAAVLKARPLVDWSERASVLRKSLDVLYAQFREAVRQSPVAK